MEIACKSYLFQLLNLETNLSALKVYGTPTQVHVIKDDKIWKLDITRRIKYDRVTHSFL